MRFTDVRQVPAPVGEVWQALHDADVLARVIPGCERLSPVAPGEYAATLAARVGCLADCYSGSFTITDDRPGSQLTVSVAGRGRCGSLAVELRVRLADGEAPATTSLAYDARARVGGLVARLGRAPLSVAGAHLTACFFRDLERAVRVPVRRQSAMA